MLFNSYHFFGFLVLVLIFSRLLRSRAVARNWMLLLASYYFYSQWNVKYLLLIITTTTVDYFVARRIYRNMRPWLMIVLSLSVNLGILFFFKYVNFAIHTLNYGLAAAGSMEPIGPLDVLLPVGISFYTFQSLSYTIDVYKKEMEPRRSFAEYALFISFFPQLVAGPIIRARTFFQQLDSGRWPGFRETQYGVSLILFGLVKKVVFADNLAPMVDMVFGDPVAYGGVDTLLAVYAFTFQIYFDFSGYSDIAIGTAALLGFSFPKNFDHPYLSTSLQEFWRRWHISLSSWLRDYLYFNLGGSLTTRLLTARNVMITMLLGGLWHGASWNFVMWGGLHGAYLVIERWIRSWRPEWFGSASWLTNGVRWFLTFHLIAFGWIFFRSETLTDAVQILENLTSFAPAGLSAEEISTIGAVTGLALLIHWFSHRVSWPSRIYSVGAFPVVVVHLAALLSLIIFNPESAVPFIYFQF